VPRPFGAPALKRSTRSNPITTMPSTDKKKRGNATPLIAALAGVAAVGGIAAFAFLKSSGSPSSAPRTGKSSRPSSGRANK